jgi:hypothetical protein
LHAFLEKALSQISGKSTLAKAIRYSLSRAWHVTVVTGTPCWSFARWSAA